MYVPCVSHIWFTLVASWLFGGFWSMIWPKNHQNRRIGDRAWMCVLGMGDRHPPNKHIRRYIYTKCDKCAVMLVPSFFPCFERCLRRHAGFAARCLASSPWPDIGCPIAGKTGHGTSEDCWGRLCQNGMSKDWISIIYSIGMGPIWTNDAVIWDR